MSYPYLNHGVRPLFLVTCILFDRVTDFCKNMKGMHEFLLVIAGAVGGYIIFLLWYFLSNENIKHENLKTDQRCNGIQTEAIITEMKFEGDAGFGNCPVFIKYTFKTESAEDIVGEFHSLESSFHNVIVGDTIAVRYLKKNPKKNLPVDCLEIILKIV